VVLHRSQLPIVEEQDVYPGEFAEQPTVAAIGARQAKIIEQAGGPAVVDTVAAAAGLMGERASDEALASAGGAGDEDLLVLLHPAAGGELTDNGFVQLAAGRIVDGLDAGLRQFELRLLQRTGETFVLPGEPLGSGRPRRQDGGAVVLGELFVGALQARLVAAGRTTPLLS
jgi:hypothetical protein